MRISFNSLSKIASMSIRKWTSRRSEDKDLASILEYAKERDPDENRETTPAEDERIDLHCLWAVELYTPSFADRLLENLERLGWDQEDFPGRESPASWVRVSRQLPEGGSWINLGIIRPRSDERPWPPRDRTAELPKNVRYAAGGLYSITPSLTCIVMKFVFDDGCDRELETALREKRITFARSVARGHQIFGPRTQKTEEVRSIRYERMVLAMGWFRENLPGIFSAGLLDGKMPTCELVTLRVQEPFPNREDERRTPQYLGILELDFALSGWVSTNVEEFKFALGLRGKGLEYHSVFALRMSDSSNGELFKPYSSMSSFVDSTYQRMIGILAIRALLEGYSRRLNRLRDRVTTGIRRASRRRPYQTLESLLADVAYDVDIAAITRELISSTSAPLRLSWEIGKFKPLHGRMPGESLAESFCRSVNELASKLQQTDSSLRDHLTQFGSLLASKENIRTQKRILLLSIFVAAVAVASFLATDVGSGLMDWVQRIWGQLVS